VHGPYSTFAGSPASEGQLQFDLWGVTPSSRFDWAELKARVVKHGLRNSLLLAPMPTASTAQILGNNESFEPFTSNIYNRRVLAGEFPVVNRHLLRDLIERGLWNPMTRNLIIAVRWERREGVGGSEVHIRERMPSSSPFLRALHTAPIAAWSQRKGSIQDVPGMPDDLKELYKTVWEIKQRTLIDMAADRGAFICQSQSLNLFIADPSVAKLTSAHFYAWRKGLKTGMYYLRTRPRADAIAFTVDQAAIAAAFTAPAPGAAVGFGEMAPTGARTAAAAAAGSPGIASALGEDVPSPALARAYAEAPAKHTGAAAGGAGASSSIPTAAFATAGPRGSSPGDAPVATSTLIDHGE